MCSLLPLRALSIFVALTLIGCTSKPLVSYEQINDPDYAGRSKFVLPRSLIKLDRKSEKDKPDILVALSLPTDVAVRNEKLTVYAISPEDSWGVKTRLKITYIDNTRIVSSVGVEVEDTRVKMIGEIAGVIAAAAPIVATLSPRPSGVAIPEKLPIVIDPKGYVSPGNDPWVRLPENDGWFYRIDFEPIPRDAVPAADFFKDHAKNVSVFPISACRDITLYAGQSKKIDEAIAFGLKTADPEKVMTVAFPEKGKIDMHTSCGANVTSEKSDVASTWAVIGEAVKQAAAIKKAYEAKTDNSTKKDSKK